MDELTKEEKVNWTWFLFSLKGRITRKPFWIFNLIVFTGWILLSVFTGTGNDMNEITKPQIMFLIWIFWPSIAVQAKRWHDRNKSAWWVAIGLIPVVGPIWAFIENGFLPGDSGENRFGSAPMEVK
jgi:uncharacterized membrane protein YhaH (DUF805 family)